MAKYEMQRFTHLTENERDEIERLLKQGGSLRSIARALRRSPSTVSRELRRHRADYSIPQPRLDPAGARESVPRLERTVDRWVDAVLDNSREHERLWLLATGLIEEAAHTYRVALKTSTVTAEVSFEALVARAITAHPEVPERMWSKAIHRAIRSVLRVRAR